MQGKHPRLQGPIFCPIASQRTGTEIAPLYGKLFRPKPLCHPAYNSQRGVLLQGIHRASVRFSVSEGKVCVGNFLPKSGNHLLTLAELNYPLPCFSEICLFSDRSMLSHL